MAQESIGALSALVTKAPQVDEQIYELASKMILDGSDKPASNQNIIIQAAQTQDNGVPAGAGEDTSLVATQSK